MNGKINFNKNDINYFNTILAHFSDYATFFAIPVASSTYGFLRTSI